jgi:hypothetical protein
MPVILRWFQYEGRRHRVWFRQPGEKSARELVIAGPGLSARLDVPETALEEFTDQRLVDLAEQARAGSATSVTEPDGRESAGSRP